MAQPSPSYVPRSVSRPASPALTPSYVPRPVSVTVERKSSGLRNEMKTEREQGEYSQGALAILKILSALPAPLPERLPPTFLPTPSASPPPPPSAPSSPPRTFTEYVHAKRQRSPHDDQPPEKGTIGLGLGLALVPDPKRMRLAVDGCATPCASPGSKKEIGQSRLRNQVEATRERRDLWKKDKWATMSIWYRDRALLLKRHGDAYLRSPTAHPQYLRSLPHDRIKGLLCLTDSAILYNYSHFCDEKGKNKSLPGVYDSSAGLRTFVRREWENEMKDGGGDGGGERKERARAMAGFMYLLEAVIVYQTGREALAVLQHRGKELHAALTPPNDSTSPGSSAASPPNPHPGAPSAPSTTAPAHSPAPAPAHSPSSTSSSSLPPDFFPLVFTSTKNSSDATHHLLLSRHHLTLRTLRHLFPSTYTSAIHSDLADRALPAPGDTLGSARDVDPDEPARFGWPIELGMCAPVAHAVAFGRGLVKEMAEREGKVWSLVMEPGS